MPFKYFDRVREGWTGTGTGDIVLEGAPDGSYEGFGDSGIMSDGDTTDIAIFGASDYESCPATYVASTNKLVRGTPYQSSNGGAAVNFGAGPKIVIMTLPASKARTLVDALGSPLPLDPVLMRGYLVGLETSNNTTTPNTKIDVSAGVATDDTQALMMRVSAGTIDCGTTGANGLDAGSLANATWYHVFAIGKTDGTTALLASTSVSAPTMPSGYTLKRRIGSFLTNGSAQITAFAQKGDIFLWASPRNDYSGAHSTTASLKTLSVPAGLKVIPIGSIFSNADINVAVSSPDTSDYAAGNAFGPIRIGAGGAMQVPYAPAFWTDTSGRLRFRSDASGSTLNINTHGWIDRRGRDG